MKERKLTQSKEVFHLGTSVFPLLDVKESVGGAPVTVEYKGTCFLMIIGQQHVFVTAKHLLQETPDKYNLYIGYNTPAGQSSFLKVSAAYVNHLSEDISFFLPTARMKKEYNQLLVPMKSLRHPLPVGQGVLVYGFPNSGQQGGRRDIPIVNIQRTRYEGKVVRVDHDCPLPAMKTVYQLDLPSPKGLSGAPIMVVHDDTLAVAGYIIGEQTTNSKSVAIATDFTPSVEIEQLLTDVSRKLASGKE